MTYLSMTSHISFDKRGDISITTANSGALVASGVGAVSELVRLQDFIGRPRVLTRGMGQAH